MSFDEKYQLLELAADEGVKTFIAREASTGRKVSIFLFVGEHAQLQAEFLDRVRAAGPAHLPGFIEIGDNRGTVYVALEPGVSFAEFKAGVLRLNFPPAHPGHKPEEFTKVGVWRVPPALQSAPSHAHNPSEEPSDRQPQKAEAPSSPGSFTQMFQAAAPPMAEPKTEAPNAPPAQPAPVQSKPGEFTRMFQAAAPPASEAKPEAPKAPQAQSAPGSFTQMFQAAAPPMAEPKTEAPNAPPAQPAPGEFTRFFNAPAPAPAAPPLPGKPGSQGDFDRIFGGGDRPAAQPSTGTGIFSQPASIPATKPDQAGIGAVPPPPPAFNAPAGEFTKIFGETSLEIPALSPGAAPSPPIAQTAAGAPGEYTRMFSASPMTQEPIAAPAPAKAPESPAPAKPNSKLVPVLIGVILLLLAAIAVLVIKLGK